jgi:hypothetical protein
MNTEAFDEPLSVEICDGEVVLIAQGHPFGVSLRGSAAVKTGEALGKAGKQLLEG